MLVESVDVVGMADLPTFSSGELGRVSHFKGPDPGSVALGDAVELFFGALAPQHLHSLLARWGLLEPDEDPDIIADPFPDQVRWSTPAVGPDFVADPQQRAITVTVTVRLDPPLFRELRAQAARHPRLITALSGGPLVTVTVGALFANTFDALALSINDARIGDERFPTLASERPAWLTRLLIAIGGRFHRYSPGTSAAKWALGALSSREQHGAYTAWQAALADRLGPVRAVEGATGGAMLLAGERPLWRWGERGWKTAALAAAVYLSGADVVWAESEDPLLADGIERGALEQVVLVGPGGSQTIASPPDTRKKATAFRARGAT